MAGRVARRTGEEKEKMQDSDFDGPSGEKLALIVCGETRPWGLRSQMLQRLVTYSADRVSRGGATIGATSTQPTRIVPTFYSPKPERRRVSAAPSRWGFRWSGLCGERGKWQKLEWSCPKCLPAFVANRLVCARGQLRQRSALRSRDADLCRGRRWYGPMGYV